MKKKDDGVYLRHILDAITTIEEYLNGINKKEFFQNKLIQDGVIRQLEIIGEAARHLSIEFTKHYSKIPWEDIIGMRHKLIHDYFGVDIEAVWLAATRDIPIFKDQIQKIPREDLTS